MFWWYPGACEILVPWTRIEPMPFPTPYSLPRTLEANSLNHWTAREVLVVAFLITLKLWISREVKSCWWLSLFQNCPVVEAQENALASAQGYSRLVWWCLEMNTCLTCPESLTTRGRELIYNLGSISLFLNQHYLIVVKWFWASHILTGK